VAVAAQPSTGKYFPCCRSRNKVCQSGRDRHRPWHHPRARIWRLQRLPGLRPTALAIGIDDLGHHAKKPVGSPTGLEFCGPGSAVEQNAAGSRFANRYRTIGASASSPTTRDTHSQASGIDARPTLPSNRRPLARGFLNGSSQACISARMRRSRGLFVEIFGTIAFRLTFQNREYQDTRHAFELKRGSPMASGRRNGAVAGDPADVRRLHQ